MRILIVDDDDFSLQLIEQALSSMGHTTVPARNGQEALEILRNGEIRLVITDWEMPGMSGLDLCRAVRHEQLAGYVYLIMLTGREGAQPRRQGLNAGADDFLNKPLDCEELEVCLNTAARILALETRDLALFALAKLAESRDPDIGSHLERVQSYSLLLARNLSEPVRQAHDINDEYLRLLYQTSALHDLGKVGIPDAVLLKPGKLTPEEFQIMKTHTIIGAQTLDAALQRFPSARFLQMARDIAASHHEKFDGSGYPSGLIGNQIPFCGRIVALADVYDAITSRRVYKASMTHAQAKEVILQGRGLHFDPDVVDAFLDAEQKMADIQTQLQDGPCDRAEPAAQDVESGDAPTLNTQLTAMNRRLEALSITDDLTGLFNRRQAMNRLEEQWSLAERYQRPLSVVMIDLDHFSQINAVHGPEAGDVILRRVAEILRDLTSGADTVCRIGGDQFLMILPSQPVTAVATCAERCRAAVASRGFTAGPAVIPATLSIGVAAYLPTMRHFTEILHVAEQALEQAKQGGRNQVCVAESKPNAAAEDVKLTVSAPAAATTSDPAPINLSEVFERCGRDRGFAIALTEQFRTQATVEAERITHALTAGDADALRRHAHNLKSMAGYMGAQIAADLSKQVEQLAHENRLSDARPIVEMLHAEIERAVQWIGNNAAASAALCA